MRPWAVLSLAMREDATLDEAARRLADGDADPDAQFEDLQRAVDHLMKRWLEAQKAIWIAQVSSNPEAVARYRELDDHWKEVKTRLLTFRSEE